jgi:Domain of unknown function DUF29
LLKLQFQTDARSNSWRSSIATARDEITAVIEDSPSLNGYPASQLGSAYARGRVRAARETGIADLPTTCPWAIEQVLNPDFWPGD